MSTTQTTTEQAQAPLTLKLAYDNKTHEQVSFQHMN